MMRNIKHLIGLSATVSLLILPSLLSQRAAALELFRGQTFFEKSPSLIESSATHTAPNVPSIYKFTIAVPLEAGQPLKAVKIKQKPSYQMVSFDISKTQAYIAKDSREDELISLASIGGEAEKEGEITIVLDKPVQPGSTVTVDLKVKHNPEHGGIYSFGVTAFPEGNRSSGLYLGSAHFHLSGSD